MTTRSLLIAAALGCTITTTLSAQTVDAPPAPAQKTGFEFLVSSGSVLPVGTEKGIIERGDLTAAQLSYVVHPALALTATVGWARSHDISTTDSPTLDLFTYDLGAEFRAPRMTVAEGVSVGPFAGVGAGARSYNYRNLDVNATHNVAAYASVGGQADVRRIGFRVEVRDYVSDFKPLSGTGKAVTGNDVMVMVGIRINK